MPQFRLNLPEKKLVARFEKKTFTFKQPAGTSRGILLQKESYFIYVSFLDHPGKEGVGECSPLWGLSIDPKEDYEGLIKAICIDINNYKAWFYDRLTEYPSIRFGLEMALKDLEQGGQGVLFPSEFTAQKDSITINGLIWMGNIGFMSHQIDEKIKKGFRCIKLKIGSNDFEKELALLKEIRSQYHEKSLEIRLDANGAFSPENAKKKLDQLCEFSIHSIEQPIKAGQWDAMKVLCKTSPIPIALDEELIGIVGWKKMQTLVQHIQPKYLILKPSLIGGYKCAEGWINIANASGIDYWFTSALESNIGLNAIAQFAYLFNPQKTQGLGTGELYTSNYGAHTALNGPEFSFQT